MMQFSHVLLHRGPLPNNPLGVLDHHPGFLFKFRLDVYSFWSFLFTLISHIFLMTFCKNDLEEQFCTFTSHTWPFSCHKSPNQLPLSFPALPLRSRRATSTSWAKLRFDAKVGNGKKQNKTIRLSVYNSKQHWMFAQWAWGYDVHKKRLVSDAFLSFMCVRLGNDCDESYTICLLISSPWKLWNSENIHNFIDNFMMIHPGRLTAGT